VILVRRRHAEQHHELVAREVVHDAAVARGRLGGGVADARERLVRLLGRELLDQSAYPATAHATTVACRRSPTRASADSRAPAPAGSAAGTAPAPEAASADASSVNAVVAVRRPLAEGAPEHRVDAGGTSRRDVGDGLRLGGEGGDQHGVLARPPERPHAGEHLVGHHAERPDVRAVVDGLAERLLGAHVGDRPDGAHRLRAAPAGQLRDPESSTFTWPSRVSITFPGLTSRCTIPRSCAFASPRAISVATRSASSTGSGPRAMRRSSVSPS
jgi:hypothetical protein